MINLVIIPRRSAPRSPSQSLSAVPKLHTDLLFFWPTPPFDNMASQAIVSGRESSTFCVSFGIGPRIGRGTPTSPSERVGLGGREVFAPLVAGLTRPKKDNSRRLVAQEFLCFRVDGDNDPVLQNLGQPSHVCRRSIMLVHGLLRCNVEMELESVFFTKWLSWGIY